MVWNIRARVRAQMNATPPEAKPEYSRADSAPEGISDVPAPAVRGLNSGGGAAVRVVVWGAGVLGALLLVVAEFTNLFTVHDALSSGPVAAMKTGSHNSYALIPIAVLALLLTVSGWRARSRPALAALAVLGLIALLIALVGDLPDAKASGLVGSAATHFTSATSRPSVGLYLETAGAIALLIAGGLGLFLIPGAPRAPKRARKAPVETE
jgi:hypothetical protein